MLDRTTPGAAVLGTAFTIKRENPRLPILICPDRGLARPPKPIY
jgi:hypothetical protein